MPERFTNALYGGGTKATRRRAAPRQAAAPEPDEQVPPLVALLFVVILQGGPTAMEAGAMVAYVVLSAGNPHLGVSRLSCPNLAHGGLRVDGRVHDLQRHSVCEVGGREPFSRAGDLMFRTFSIPITWSELIKRTVKEINEDDCLGLAAQLAYYLLLALVPAIVFLVALASFFPADTVSQMIGSLRAFAPGDVVQLVQEQLQRVANGQQGGLLTVGIAMALWSSSAAIVSVSAAMNRAYDIEEGRPWWKVRLIAIALTIGLALFVIAAIALVMIGPTVGQQVAARFGLGTAFAWTWTLLQWPVAVLLVGIALALLNYFAPDAEQDWEWITPGAALSTVLWLIASLAFKIYLANFADYNATYGSLGGVIVLMLWFYISALAVLAGSEMNAEIEHASPHGKDPGEKVPGQRKKLGAAAARAYAERLHLTRPAAPQRAPGPTPGQTAPGVAWYLATFMVLVWTLVSDTPEKA